MPRRFAIGSAQDLVQAERDIRARVGDAELDFAAMAAVSNIYRAANAIRNHMEQQVLAEEDLSWAAFTVLFVLWIWGDQQTRHLAAEAGVTKGTLTGVLKTLEKRGLARRRGHDADGRLVLVSLEPKGQDVIAQRKLAPLGALSVLVVICSLGSYFARLNRSSRMTCRASSANWGSMRSSSRNAPIICCRVVERSNHSPRPC